MDRFGGRVVWITGASSGIGEALAHAFAGEGARVVLSSRRPAELERVRQALPRAAEHWCVPLDLARAPTFPGIVAEVRQLAGRIDILVNNGGVSQRALALDATLEVERALMEVDYFGPVALTKAVLPGMLEQRAGHVVVISSVMGYVGTPGRSTYAAAKHALHGYFDSLRAEVWREGIKVTLVCPGYVLTQVSANAVGPRGEKHGVTDATHERGISPGRVARATLDAVARGREEIAIGGTERWAILLKRLLPGVAARVIRGMKFSVHAGEGGGR
ncbi:MAG: SDR family oxidoreductase [Verrucomicrobia bacterium]|nr:SDR family oxidoreductase [Verrucomicrobiota bacterium]